MSRTPSRRDLLKLAGATAGASLVTGSVTETSVAGAAQPARVRRRPAREPLKALTAPEADLLDRIAELLVPSDEHGPGATEAMAVRYIDRALAGALSDQREAYRVGLEALERYAKQTRGAAFLQLPETKQISLLIDVESGTATGANVGFAGSSAQFFGLVRGHVMQGTFGDPYYGGNEGFVGWDLLGYPGVRTVVTPAEQKLLSPPTRVRRSAYENPMFNKAVVDMKPAGKDRDAD
ncbi:MAG: gluconate 2-dehydrogenase subunit 3 family protein [Acidobacteria bacterium]|nr:gluconate 2-dehydrogenase subunit 3 family protein [Acidobacteriota bacterium]